MSYRERVLFTLTLTIGTACAVLSGQPAPSAPPASAPPTSSAPVAAAPAAPKLPPPIPNAVKQAGANLGPAEKDQIAKTISAALDVLASDTNPKPVREFLISQVATIPPNPAPDPFFVDAYADRLNKELINPTGTIAKANIRARLNAAIVTNAVANISQTSQLSAAAAGFINDKQDCVAIWGMRAARPMINSALQIPAPPPLVNEILKAVKDRPTGLLAGEAYATFTITNPAIKPPVIIQHILPAYLTVFNTRIAVYKKGIPDDPEADKDAVLFLLSTNAWNNIVVIAPGAPLQVMQAMVDLVGMASQQAQNANPQQREQMSRLINYSGQCLQFSPPGQANAALGIALQNMIALPANATPQQIQAASTPLLDALKAIPGFEKLNPAPTIEAAPQQSAQP